MKRWGGGVGAVEIEVKTTNPSKQGLKLRDWGRRGLLDVCQNDESIKTRIETVCVVCLDWIWHLVKTTNPSKQGLKHVCRITLAIILTSQNDESIKTRIETGKARGSPRRNSVKTTNPSKQGLKQVHPYLGRVRVRVKTTNPSKQGLKQYISHMYRFAVSVKTTNPSKQELKQLGPHLGYRGEESKRRIHQNKD